MNDLVGAKILAAAGVDFVLVGVGGINFYALDDGDAVLTRDLDCLIRPSPANLKKALGSLAAAGFRFEANREPFLDFDDEGILASVVRHAAVVTALHGDATRLDLMLGMRGFSYDQVAGDAAVFRVEDQPIRVGRLEKLLRAKELAGRPKDLEFLRMFAARYRDRFERG